MPVLFTQRPATNSKPKTRFAFGYRYWSVDKQGRLFSPFCSDFEWKEGWNTKQTNSMFKNTTGESPGLYAFKHIEDSSTGCNPSYFNLKDGRLHNGKASNLFKGLYHLVGTIVAHDFSPGNSDMLWAEQAKISALALPTDYNLELQTRTQKAIELYGVPLLDPKQLFEYNQALVKNL